MKIIAAHEHQPSPEGLKVIELPNDANPFELDLAGVDRIDLQFPKFTDGRAYSQAFLLRRRLGFTGEIRATGDVLIDQFVHRYFDLRPSAIAGLDARGFIIGSVLAYELNVGFVPIRKKGKLPFTTVEETYELEYGSATVELHTDAVRPGQRVLLIDDLIATGGTMMAGMRLLQRLGAHVIEGAAIVDLPELGGSARLREAGLPLFTLVDFDGH
mgnify:CR=1 FL=1